MAIDITTEQLIDFNEAAELLPEGSRPTYATWWRWATKGVGGVKLETVKIGAKRATTASAVARFVETLTARSAGDAEPTRSTMQRKAAIKKARAELAAAGV